MNHKLLFATCVLLCLSICVSCEKTEKPVITPIDTTPISTDGFIGLDKIMPELISKESMKYDEHMGYYISFPEQDWEKSLIVEPSYIPSQSIPCSFKATRTAIPESSGWDADDVRRVVLKDIVVSCFYETDLIQAECDGVFKMRLSLGENVPYRKVTLTDCEVAFSEWFRATAESSFSELEVTAEGTVISFRLDSIQDPDRFLDGYAQICYNLDVSFHAHATVSPEDYIGSVSETPAELELCCDFEFDQIDFTTCGLHFEGDAHSINGRVSCMDTLPSPFPGEGSDITFTSPRIFIDYKNEVPFTSARVNVVAFFDDDLTHPTVEFSLSENGKYLFMPKDDGINREEIKTVEIESMERLDSGPFSGKYKQALLELQQEFSHEGTFRTNQYYKMHMAVEWWLPLAFTGTPNNISLETPRIELNGKKLNAKRGYVHEFSQEIGGDLPFECLITPVFTFGEHEPIFLDSFVLDKNTTKKVVYQFPTATDYWKATFHYLITVTKGTNEFFTKDYGLATKNTVFTANLEKSQTVYTR